MMGVATAQESSTTASYKVSWLLAKKKKPFTDSELMKDVMIEVIKDVVHDQKVQKDIIKAVDRLPLSDSTNMRRVTDLAADVMSSLTHDLNKSDCYALALDESTDNCDTAQLCLFVRFLDGDTFREELLGLVPLQGRTTSEDVYSSICEFFGDNSLDKEKVHLLCTDGAPAMVGVHTGLVARWRKDHSNVLALHCIVHQTVLCGKLSGSLKSTMDSVVSCVNYVRCNSALQHRLFKQLLKDNSAEHNDLLLHNDVRWLSKGKTLERFCCLHGDVLEFLEASPKPAAAKFVSMLKSEDFMAEVNFIKDMFKHLNDLNLCLQGKNRTVNKLHSRMKGFILKCDIFIKDLKSPSLHTTWFPSVGKVTNTMIDFVVALKANFETRSEQIVLPTELLAFGENPFAIDINGIIGVEASRYVNGVSECDFLSEVINLQSDSSLKNELTKFGPEEFWLALNKFEFPCVKSVGVFVMSMFGSTYCCESAFSHMNALKTRERNRLCDSTLQDCLRISLTDYKPDFKKLASVRKNNFSH